MERIVARTTSAPSGSVAPFGTDQSTRPLRLQDLRRPGRPLPAFRTRARDRAGLSRRPDATHKRERARSGVRRARRPPGPAATRNGASIGARVGRFRRDGTEGGIGPLGSGTRPRSADRRGSPHRTRSRSRSLGGFVGGEGSSPLRSTPTVRAAGRDGEHATRDGRDLRLSVVFRRSPNP